MFSQATVICLHKTEQANVIMMRGNSRRHTKAHHDRNRFGLYLRLFTIMGSTCSLEIIHWLVTDSQSFFLHWVKDVLETLYFLLSILFFLLFIWKPRVKKLLLQRFGCSKGEIIS
ncbi:G-protein coupled receptor Mth2-like isoform X2 [Anopheles darlingi]|uniref:G-protein coupled receptor Mth2-like isoform X2 n=1 Tax=Anopheles darlingi TaxID=43151 RepID=UPI0020FFFAE0|nr:G-protein coupled receptor Mth2-like isoform X2 [Anopheles darlingi]